MNPRAKAIGRQSLLLAVLLTMLVGGWGFEDPRGFFSHPARAGYVVMVLVGTLYVLIFCPNVNPFRKGIGVKRHWVEGLWAMFGLTLVAFLPFCDRRNLLTISDGGTLRYVGLALALLGGGLRLIGLASLGKQFSGFVTLQEDHELVQTGLYSHIRHPMYLGYVLAIAGLALVFRSWLVIPMLGLSLAFVLNRIPREERLLRERFGGEFEAYRHRTWKMIPYLY